MIPARMGSQRLKRKNLRMISGIPLITHTIRRAHQANCFDQVWVNSEHQTFAEIAKQENVYFHARPPEFADDKATSEQYVYQFLQAHPCEFLVQVHTIAPLLTADMIAGFVEQVKSDQFDVLLSVVNEQIECVYKGEPINFSFETKSNSQALAPVKRISWSISAWRAETFIHAYEHGDCATYAGRIGYYPVDHFAGHIIKTQADLVIAEALLQARRHLDEQV